MRNVFEENNIFQEFSERCQEQLRIKKELSDPKISKEKKKRLEEHLNRTKQEISELVAILQEQTKLL